VGEQPLQVGRDAEDRGGALAADHLADAVGVEVSWYDEPPTGQQGPGREPQRRGVVQRAEHEVHVVGREPPQVALLGDESRCLRLVEQPGEHALGTTGRAARQVHGATERRTRGRCAGERCEHVLELLLRGDDQNGVEVVEQLGTLAWGQLRVHRNREDAPAQQGDHQLDVRHRTGHEQCDPAPRDQVARFHALILSGCPGR
jgi:hypothetical protein